MTLKVRKPINAEKIKIGSESCVCGQPTIAHGDEDVVGTVDDETEKEGTEAEAEGFIVEFANALNLSRKHILHSHILKSRPKFRRLR